MVVGRFAFDDAGPTDAALAAMLATLVPHGGRLGFILSRMIGPMARRPFMCDSLNMLRQAKAVEFDRPAWAAARAAGGAVAQAWAQDDAATGSAGVRSERLKRAGDAAEASAANLSRKASNDKP